MAHYQREFFSPAPLPTAKLGDGERLACLRLIRSENVGPVSFRELINHFGGAERALAALPELSRRGGRSSRLRVCPRSDAEAELEAAEKIGAAAIFTIEPGYPRLLAAVEVAPPLVYVKGRTDIFEPPAVAIVGSRECSAAGAKVANQFAARIAHAGYVVVSGMARGIDRVAHESSLDRGTIAVLAGGVDNIYPPEHAKLYASIAERGAIISEMAPGFAPRGRDFPRRNRIIAGLALGVVIVEAAARSGTLVTARYAGEHGREVFAVPGHPLDPRAEGTNKLIKSGATLVTSADDVLEVLKPIAGLGAPSGDAFDASAAVIAAAPAIPDVGEAERGLVLKALGPAPTDLDAMALATGLPPRDIRIALLELDLAGRISRPGPGLFALRVAD